MVGVVGFEPTISCSQSTCDARLRYTPTLERGCRRILVVLAVRSESSPLVREADGGTRACKARTAPMDKATTINFVATLRPRCRRSAANETDVEWSSLRTPQQVRSEHERDRSWQFLATKPVSPGSGLRSKSVSS